MAAFYSLMKIEPEGRGSVVRTGFRTIRDAKAFATEPGTYCIYSGGVRKTPCFCVYEREEVRDDEA